MKIRELLQTEIWSKGTTRRIFVVLGIIFGIGLVSSFLLYEYETRRLTQGERDSARAALAQIEWLRECGSCSYEDFQARDIQVKRAVEWADVSSSTYRDSTVVWALRGYQTTAESVYESDYEDPRIEKMIEERHLPHAPKDPEFEEKRRLSNQKLIRFWHLALHKTLD